MPRPEGIKRKKPKKKKNKGKDFESDFMAGLKMCPGFPLRITDKMSVGPDGKMKRMAGSETPADFFYTDSNRHALIEAKSQVYRDLNGCKREFRFDKVAEHQVEGLLRFNAQSRRHIGLVAVFFWNGELKHAEKIKRAWLIPIHDYLKKWNQANFMSMNMNEVDQIGHEMDWLPGKQGACWNVHKALKEILP